MDWKIAPLLGVGPLRFGMTRDEVSRAAPGLGPVQSAFPTWDGKGLSKHRALDEPTFGYGDKGLDSIGFDRRVPGVLFCDTDLFANEPAIVARLLYQANEVRPSSGSVRSASDSSALRSADITPRSSGDFCYPIRVTRITAR